MTRDLETGWHIFGTFLALPLDWYSCRNSVLIGIVCMCESDVDECREQPRICGVNGTCRNSQGSYRCSCNDGFDISPAGSCAGGSSG